MTETPFLQVTSKKRRNRNQKVQPSNQTAVDRSRIVKDEFDTSRAISSVEGHFAALSNSNLFRTLLDAVLHTEKPEEIICFGLGSLNSFISRYQLALGILLQKEFTGCRATYSDPCFSRSDTEVLHHFRIHVLEENLEGKYLANSDYVTLYYLPHCPKQLVNNLLWRNWHQLERLCLITNSFESIVERTPSRLLAEVSYIQQVKPYTVETVLPDFDSGDIFNDLAVITFKNLPESLLSADTPEPVYTEDIELIQAQ